MTDVAVSPDVRRILTVKCGWTTGQHEQRLAQSLRALLRRGLVDTPADLHHRNSEI